MCIHFQIYSQGSTYGTICFFTVQLQIWVVYLHLGALNCVFWIIYISTSLTKKPDNQYIPSCKEMWTLESSRIQNLSYCCCLDRSQLSIPPSSCRVTFIIVLSVAVILMAMCYRKPLDFLSQQEAKNARSLIERQILSDHSCDPKESGAKFSLVHLGLF